MKYQGRKLSGPRKIVVPIIRDEGNIILQVQAVVDMTPFEALCPVPQPPALKMPGGKVGRDIENVDYKKASDAWWKTRSIWIFLQALSASEGLEWEKVKLSDPSTYHLYDQEMKDAGFSDAEMTRIFNAVAEVNGLNESLVEEARQSFLVGQAAPKNGQSSPTAGVPITPSGVPASK